MSWLRCTAETDDGGAKILSRSRHHDHSSQCNLFGRAKKLNTSAFVYRRFRAHSISSRPILIPHPSAIIAQETVSMTSSLLPCAARRRLLCSLPRSWSTYRELSTYADPSRYVAGVTNEDLANDPVLAAYFAANFPEDEPVLTGKQDKGDQVEDDLNVRVLSCLKRDPEQEEGSRSCRRLRHEHFIPGLLYGSDPTQGIFSHDASSQIFIKTPWTLLQRELDLYHRNFESRVYDLTVYEDPEDTIGTVHTVVPRDVQRHPVQSTIFCANFLRYFPGRPIKIPIVYINEEESPALKRGAFLAPISRHVECVVEEGVPIPVRLELECTGLRVRDVVRMERIVFPDGVKPSRRVDLDQFLVGTVFGKRMKDDLDEEGEGAEAKGEGDEE